MDAIAAYGMSKGWDLCRNIVLVEGTSDEALFKLSDKLARSVGVELLGKEISVVAAGESKRGGTYGVGRELITLRAMAPYILDREGDPVYRIVGLFDNDCAGRRMIEDIARIDRGVIEFRDVLRLWPIMPRQVAAPPDCARMVSELENAAFCGLDWEIEDTLSERLISRFAGAFPHTIRQRVTLGERTHLEFTREGKRELHALVQREASLDDLAGVVDVLRFLRALFGLSDVGAAAR